MASQIKSILLFFAVSASGWAFCDRWFPELSTWTVIGLWTALLIYAWRSRSSEKWETKADENDSRNLGDWPKKSTVAIFLLVFIGGVMVSHRILNGLLGRPFHWEGWSSPTWAASAFLVFYPKSLDRPWEGELRRFLVYLCPVFIAVVLWAHTARVRTLENEMVTAPSADAAAAQAFAADYPSLGIRAAILEILRQNLNEGWGSAAVSLRRQWIFADKIGFARTWRSHPVAGKDLFFFTTVFGGKLLLQKGEEAVDFIYLSAAPEYRVLTSKGRLLRITTHGVECFGQTFSEPIALTVVPVRETTAILTQKREVWMSRENGTFSLVLPLPDRRWKDLKFSADGETLWLLDNHGAVEAFVASPEGNRWNYKALVSPPLWGEEELAQTFIPTRDEKHFLLLDVCGGVHVTGENSSASLPFGDKDLIHYYNPNERIIQDLAVWSENAALMVLNQYGRVDFIFPGLATKSPGGQKIAAEIPYRSVRAEFQFDKSRGLWFYQPGAVAFAAIPEADTILELFRDGTLQPIAMPYGVRVRLEDQSARIRTDVASPAPVRN